MSAYETVLITGASSGVGRALALYGGRLLESPAGAAAHLHALATLREMAWSCERFGPRILVGDPVTEPLCSKEFHVHLHAIQSGLPLLPMEISATSLAQHSSAIHRE